jgi:hypothetical protein
MEFHRRDPSRLAFAAALVCLVAARDGHALPAAHAQPDAIQVAQAPEPSPGELQPRYTPVPPEPKSWYNSSYIFGMTRGVAGSTMAPAAKAPLFLLTVPLDLVLLPFEAIGGLFG